MQANNLIVDYTETGIGVPMVFIPGITEFKEAFEFQLRGLQDSYRVISYDLRRGLKRSSDYTLELLVSDLRGFLSSLGLDSAVICGHSFGGLVAMQFALQYPAETKALVLVSSFATAPEISLEQLLGWISSADHPLRTSIGARVRVHLSRLMSRKTSGALAMDHQYAAVKKIAHQAVKISKATVSQRLRIVQKADFRAALSGIVAPTLVVTGAHDRPFFLSSAQELYEGIPDSTLEVVESGAHFCFLTRHDVFNEAVDDFLTERLAEIA